MKVTKMFVISTASVLLLILAAGWWFYLPIHLSQSKVKEVLIDPDSAKFNVVKFYRATGSTCGKVNSKNRMGGYVGDTIFTVDADGVVSFFPSTSLEPPIFKVPRNLDMMNSAKDSYVAAAYQRIAALDQQIAFVKMFASNCPDSDIQFPRPG